MRCCAPAASFSARSGIRPAGHPVQWPRLSSRRAGRRTRPATISRSGSLRLSKDGYLERKVTDDPSLAPVRRWVGVHRLVWIAANGPVPPQHIVAFKRGRRTTDPALITLDALELITLAENMRRNSLHNYPREIVHVHQLRAAITRQINRRANTEDNSHEP